MTAKKQDSRDRYNLAAAAEFGRLRKLRKLTMRDVHAHSRRIGQQRRSRLFEIVPSRLHLIEGGKQVPHLFRLYSLSVIYRTSLQSLLRLYGLDAGSNN
jgi:hypothetical protein